MYHLADLDTWKTDHTMVDGTRTHGSKPARTNRKSSQVLGAPKFFALPRPSDEQALARYLTKATISLTLSSIYSVL